jgi:hypothetical protein
MLTLALAGTAAADEPTHMDADTHTEHRKVMAFVDEGFSFGASLEGPTGGWTRVKRVTPPPRRERANRAAPPTGSR